MHLTGTFPQVTGWYIDRNGKHGQSTSQSGHKKFATKSAKSGKTTATTGI
jgi:hypothetical protein